jgi:16S rRNA (adenine1518-N6/adenine1519-N6)-dimethyltransferase
MIPKKSLGQNFLRDQDVLAKIIQAADLKADDFVIEIGPGTGALSTLIQTRVKKFIMIEKDNTLAEEVARNFQFPTCLAGGRVSNFQTISNDQNYKFQNEHGIISGDILKINLHKLIVQNNFQNYKLVANIPYYITSPIIQLFLETKYPPTEMILMVQKEVAERICSRPGQMSILAVSVQYYAKAELLFHVDKKSFWPVPEVDSAVIRIAPFSQSAPFDLTPSPPQPHPPRITGAPSPCKGEGNKKFFRVVKAGFSAKRKMLSNNLANSLHLPKETVEEKLKKAGIEPTQRAQELSVEEWKKLTKIM